MTTFTVGKDDDGRRVDRIARKLLTETSLSEIYRAIRTGAIKLNGRRIKQASRANEGDELSVADQLLRSVGSGPDRRGNKTTAAGSTRGAGAQTPRVSAAAVEGIVVYENSHVLALNKPVGALVHGDAGLDDSVRDYLAGSLTPSLSFRPGPIHRLDRNTSGLLLFAKTLEGAQALTRALGTAKKRYLGVIEGHLDGTQRWSEALSREESTKRTVTDEGGKAAFTEAFPLLYSKSNTLALFTITTGRTHQIRAHAGAHGHPLIGDRKYGGPQRSGGYLLHAWEILFDQPAVGIACLTAEPPITELTGTELTGLFGAGPLSTVLRQARSCTESMA